MKVVTTCRGQRSRSVGRLLIAVTACGWVLLALVYYLSLPLFGVLSLLGWLLLAACILTAMAGSIAIVIRLLMARKLLWATCFGVAAAAAAVAIFTADWLEIYTESQFWLHQNDLRILADHYRDGELRSDQLLPWHLRYLSIDGRVHIRENAIYLPAWQDWRGENGGGFAYFRTTPTPDTVIRTAMGDIGSPRRALGDGWWWVE